MSVARYVGLVEEASFNQSPAPAAVAHVDIASASLDAPNDTQMIYGGGLQRSAVLHRPGFYAPSGNLVYAFDINTIGFLLKWALGGYVFTEDGGTGSFNLHEYYGSPANVLPSFCTRVGKDHFEHVFSGCSINSLEIKVEGEFCQATAEINCARDSKDTIKSIQSLLLPDAYPLAFYEVTANVDSSDLSSKVKTLTLNINNNIGGDSGRGLGSRHPYRFIAGERETTFAMDLFYENTAVLEKLWGGSTGPVIGGSSEFPIVLTFDSGAYGSIEITLPNVIYTQVNQQPSGREEIVQSTAGRAMMGEYTLESTDVVDSEIGVRMENLEGVYGAYPGSISGTVIYMDGEVETPLVGVVVTSDTGETDTTDASGEYTLADVPSGTRTLTFVKTGYTTDTLDEVVLDPAEALADQDITLVATP